MYLIQFSLTYTVADSGEKKINEVAVSINDPIDLVRISSTLFCSSDGRCSSVLGLIVVVFAKLITPLDDVFGCCHDGQRKKREDNQ